MELNQHPLSAAFPSMSADDFAALVEDIKAHGQREPIMLFEGMVLDGWHRYQACGQLGIKADRFDFKGDDPVAFVLSHNLHRRHLSASQRAAAVVACARWAPSGRPKKTEAASTFSTNAELAKAAGTTVRTITDVKAATKAGLGEEVREGVVSAEQAANIARGKAPKERNTVAPPAPAPRGQTLPPADDFGPTADEIATAEREQEAEFATLRLLLESDDKLAALTADNKKLRALVAVLESRVNGLQNEKNAALSATKSWQRKAEKFERELKALKVAA
jgi:hypothetical protein